MDLWLILRLINAFLGAPIPPNNSSILFTTFTCHLVPPFVASLYWSLTFNWLYVILLNELKREGYPIGSFTPIFIFIIYLVIIWFVISFINVQKERNTILKEIPNKFNGKKTEWFVSFPTFNVRTVTQLLLKHLKLIGFTYVN